MGKLVGIFLFVSGLASANSASPVGDDPFVNYEIGKNCQPVYKRANWGNYLSIGWNHWKTQQYPMTECKRDPKKVATRIEIHVDKAGRDDTPSRGMLREAVTLMKKQKMTVKVWYEGKDKPTITKYTVSTGNKFRKDGSIDKSNITPVGSFSLKEANNRLRRSQRIQNSQAYCVEGKQYSYRGQKMPHAIFFKPGYAIHAGPTSGGPASHGCIRMHPHSVKKLYCLLRQRKDKLSAENWERTTLKIVDDASAEVRLASQSASGVPLPQAKPGRR